MTLVIASQLEADHNAAIARHPAHPEVITPPEDEPWRVADKADVLIIRPSPAWRNAPRDKAPPGWPGRIRWVFSASVGVDYYPAWLFEAPVVSCARGTASEEIADYVIAAIYARAKNLADVAVHSAEQWQYRELGRVVGSTIGVIGLGAIGTAVARRAAALGARVLAVRRSRKGVVGVIGVEMRDTAAEVVSEADHIVVAVPATPETRHLFDEALLAQVRPGAHLINVARGSVVDQEALRVALDNGQISFATLDVTDPEPLPDGHWLYNHPSVLLTPHLSSNYTLARGNLLDKLLGDLSAFIDGQNPADIVDRARGY
ncbi:putative dehydrogenase [Novosphingobium nitrogenifigens DSM 19370]|uniref:Putative dehydrogenase n=1 Tax=Novosphingobium nitrogenifigens DSM 19370 TaxID=983920 RepID=F1ZDI6_9SPHN|nr:D-isomer specific 2-hydroxyacid dehydrogenase family protein [Novosphingobium nitrogenifigens]EGD57273.1 putative dehydrogenase [Novosphingobium nitrogenifigens DSM 19370]